MTLVTSNCPPISCIHSTHKYSAPDSISNARNNIRIQFHPRPLENLNGTTGSGTCTSNKPGVSDPAQISKLAPVLDNHQIICIQNRKYILMYEHIHRFNVQRWQIRRVWVAVGPLVRRRTAGAVCTAGIAPLVGGETSAACLDHQLDVVYESVLKPSIVR
ncbi:hypothetical protein BC835DRAFT_484423 [Cytidiella melzeri]|nr:hypothetical protein BC835DRAFT_484423 [Cytidiella melzeri]